MPVVKPYGPHCTQVVHESGHVETQHSTRCCGHAGGGIVDTYYPGVAVTAEVKIDEARLERLLTSGSVEDVEAMITGKMGEALAGKIGADAEAWEERLIKGDPTRGRPQGIMSAGAALLPEEKARVLAGMERSLRTVAEPEPPRFAFTLKRDEKESRTGNERLLFRVLIDGRFVWWARFSRQVFDRYPFGRRAFAERTLKNLLPSDGPWEPGAEAVAEGVDRQALYDAAVAWLEKQP